MNEIAKTNIKEKLESAIKLEALSGNEVAKIFDMNPSYVSWIKNPKYWDNIGETFWERVLSWVNSGQKLRVYAEKKGKVLSEQKFFTDPGVVPKKEETAPEQSKSVIKEEKPDPKHDFSAELGVDDVKSDTKLTRGADMVQKANRYSPTAGEMVDVLMKEKAELQSKIDAIDVLLKHYIS